MSTLGVNTTGSRSVTRLRSQESLDRCIDADVVDEVETEQAAGADPVHRLGSDGGSDAHRRDVSSRSQTRDARGCLHARARAQMTTAA